MAEPVALDVPVVPVARLVEASFTYTRGRIHSSGRLRSTPSPWVSPEKTPRETPSFDLAPGRETAGQWPVPCA